MAAWQVLDSGRYWLAMPGDRDHYGGRWLVASGQGRLDTAYQMQTSF